HLGVDAQGHAALIETRGNPDTHLVLRGGKHGPNYHEQSVANAVAILEQKGLTRRLMIDCSHANSGKDPLRQPEILTDLLRQRKQGQRAIAAIMLESHLETGNQPLGPSLQYGLSITDACLGWEQTREALVRLHQQC
ncbi:MAG: 3-deoxy-7-phosphoheptulonate synthase, partial [Alcanivorax sp.]|nr:3-deoxy-7-phosphoheptulonate synthase [Alcanivorax sp.]